MQIAEIKKRLESHFPEAQIEVIDLMGAGDGDTSKVQVEIKSEAFKGLSRIKQHQTVMSVFESELKSGELHAMTIKTSVKIPV